MERRVKKTKKAKVPNLWESRLRIPAVPINEILHKFIENMAARRGESKNTTVLSMIYTCYMLRSHIDSNFNAFFEHYGIQAYKDEIARSMQGMTVSEQKNMFETIITEAKKPFRKSKLGLFPEGYSLYSSYNDLLYKEDKTKEEKQKLKMIETYAPKLITDILIHQKTHNPELLTAPIYADGFKPDPTHPGFVPNTIRIMAQNRKYSKKYILGRLKLYSAYVNLEKEKQLEVFGATWQELEDREVFFKAKNDPEFFYRFGM